MKHAAHIIAGAITATSTIGCAEVPKRPSEMGCEYERIEGTCEVTLTLNPRETEDPAEATSLLVRWEWTGKGIAGEVPDRVTTYELAWREASSRAATIDAKDNSRCIVEVGTAPERCLPYRAIIFVEAEP